MKNIKKPYSTPMIEVITFENVDVITTSDPDEGEWDTNG